MKRVVGMACMGILAASMLVGCAKGGSKSAADEQKGEITAKTGKRLQEIGALLQSKKFEDALEEIDDLAASDNLNPYERAKVFQMRAGAHGEFSPGHVGAVEACRFQIHACRRTVEMHPIITGQQAVERVRPVFLQPR